MQIEDSPGCWVDVFELSRYRGRQRRLFGPNVFAALRSRSSDWGFCIDSLQVGPNAHVRLFIAAEPTRGSFWFRPHQTVTDLLELRIGDDVDSIQISDRPPVDGDPGYAEFAAMPANEETHG